MRQSDSATIDAAVAVESYRDLIAWKKSMELVRKVYQQTNLLPGDERFGLVSQMRRCAIGIPSNIAEGWGRHHGSEYVRFLQFSRGSTFELSTQAEICVRLGYQGEWSQVLDACNEIGRILNGLITAVQRRVDQQP